MPTPAPVPSHQWLFDESSGNVAYDVAGIANGTLNNADRVSPGAFSNFAVHINGADNSFVSFSPAVGQFGISDFSVTFWLKTTETVRLFDLIGNRTASSHGNFLAVRMTGNHESLPRGLITAEVDQDGAGANYISVNSGIGGFNDGQWHTVAVVRQGTTLKLYVDGALRGSESAVGIADIANGNDFRLGRSVQWNVPRFAPDAVFDDVRVYNVAITPEAPGLTLQELNDVIAQNAPVVRYHPDERFLPCSVEWLLQNSWLCKNDGTSVQATVDNLPTTGTDDRTYWLQLKSDTVRSGNLPSAKAYVHAKPSAAAAGCTDISFWVCFAFNGPGTAKLFPFSDSIELGVFGEHQGDWETLTLRVDNATKQVVNVYLSQHDSGVWLPPASFNKVNGRIVVYASRNGHASYAQTGSNPTNESSQSAPWPFSGDIWDFYLRNDCAEGGQVLDCAANYQLVSAEFLGSSKPTEPRWLDYPYRWGARIVYPSGAVNQFLNSLGVAGWLLSPLLRWLLNALPSEVKEEEGPTGPKQKGSWFGNPED